ncbi:MAG: terpene cyclase/mutase family protein, partial [Planctomycetales bacterium]|nr:terpene cyclase/mutase family protein [Planctomycetales bacterium]
GAGIGLPFSPAWSQQKQEPERLGAELITGDAQRAINRALEYLTRKQVKNGRSKGCFGTGGYASGVATCSLAGLGFMAAGNPPGQGPYGRNVDMCVEFIVNSTQDTGFIAPGGHSNDQMYGHGFATLFLAEVYGMTQREDVGDKLRKAVGLICRTQNNEGGWRYQPVKSDADLSITICQIMALRASRDAGINVPIEVRNKCLQYVKRSQNGDGSFRYTLSGGGGTFPLTAAGIVSLYSAGIYEGKEVENGLKWLSKYPPNSSSASHGHYFYGQYYAVQAMWQAGGDYWKNWYTAIRDKLINDQASDGSWNDPSIGPEFGTGMGLIIMNMPNNYLPIFSK